ncbi:hypothetical protein LCGC14_2530930, partial [marine sediment metagenome]
LDALTSGDTSYPLVIFCLDECWMSWNAARRAVEWGYDAVHWYPGGTDLWTFEDHPTEVVTPQEPQPRQGQ